MPRSVDLDSAVVIEVLLTVIRHLAARPVQLARHRQGHSPPVALSDLLAVIDRFERAEAVEKEGPARF